VQQRLAELGFFTEPITGSFGPLSRQALRDFKTRSGLVADDSWTTEVQARLFDPNAPKADRRMAAEPGKVEDPGKPADAARAQKRLAELGFFNGRIDGAWGPASRAALRDFKVVNGLAADDRWDVLTSAFLEDDQALSAPESFLGTWAADPGECRYGADAALRISARRAESPSGMCSFGPVERDRLGWRMKASCAANGASWNAAVRLAVGGGRLRWSSERGTAVYVRCGYGSARGPMT
jgi:peptidoglycan hydrolase-like protein with peptidoglycan-binding domain